jgi:hypothetical protein
MKQKGWKMGDFKYNKSYLTKLEPSYSWQRLNHVLGKPVTLWATNRTNDRLTSQPTDRSTNWQNDRPTDRQTNRLTVWLNDQQNDRTTNRTTSQPTNRSTDQQTNRQTDQSTNQPIKILTKHRTLRDKPRRLSLYPFRDSCSLNLSMNCHVTGVALTLMEVTNRGVWQSWCNHY